MALHTGVLNDCAVTIYSQVVLVFMVIYISEVKEGLDIELKVSNLRSCVFLRSHLYPVILHCLHVYF